MKNFQYKLAQFLYGRNGLDGLGYALMALYFLVFVVSLFIYSVWLTVLGTLLFLLMFYRVLSRNLTRRRRENEVYMRLFNPVKGFFKQNWRRLKDIKTHRYRTCPGCKVTMRLPIKRGKNTVVCPKCGRRVEVRVWI